MVSASAYGFARRGFDAHLGADIFLAFFPLIFFHYKLVGYRVTCEAVNRVALQSKLPTRPLGRLLKYSLSGLLFVTTVSGSRLLHTIEELLDEINIFKVSLPHSLKNVTSMG